MHAVLFREWDLFTFSDRISVRREAPDGAAGDEGIAEAFAEEADAPDGCLAANRKLTEKVNKPHKWKGRVKGRDWYDWVYLVRQKAVLPLQRLTLHMQQAGTLEKHKKLTRQDFNKLIQDKIAHINFNAVKADIQPFILDNAQINDWSPEFFHYILTQTHTEE